MVAQGKMLLPMGAESLPGIFHLDVENKKAWMDVSVTLNEGEDALSSWIVLDWNGNSGESSSLGYIGNEMGCFKLQHEPDFKVQVGASTLSEGIQLTSHERRLEHTSLDDLPEGLGISLLGQSFLRTIEPVRIEGDKMILGGS